MGQKKKASAHKAAAKAAEASAMRDYTIARIAACRLALSTAIDGCDEAMAHFVDPTEDSRGEERTELLEAIDDAIGHAAAAVQMAQEAFVDCDPSEGEPSSDDDEEDDDDDEEEDEDEDEDDEGE